MYRHQTWSRSSGRIEKESFAHLSRPTHQPDQTKCPVPSGDEHMLARRHMRPVVYIFSDFRSRCITGQRKTLGGTYCLSFSAFMSSQTAVIRWCSRDCQRSKCIPSLQHIEHNQFSSLGSRRWLVGYDLVFSGWQNECFLFHHPESLLCIFWKHTKKKNYENHYLNTSILCFYHFL